MVYQAEDGIRDLVRSRGLGDVYKRQTTDLNGCTKIDTLTITEPDTLVPLILPSTFIGAVNLRCFGDSSGTATAVSYTHLTLPTSDLV